MDSILGPLMFVCAMLLIFSGYPVAYLRPRHLVFWNNQK